MIQKTRRQSISAQNIQSAWRATGLIQHNPSAVFRKLSASNNTDNDTSLNMNTPRFLSGQIPPTPGNIKQVLEIEELVLLFRHQTLDSLKLAILHKTLKAARLAMADRFVLSRTNTELLAVIREKDNELNVPASNTMVRSSCFESRGCGKKKPAS